MDNSIKISVLMLAYNREDYISTAIEGVVKQKTNFKFELVIGEDCSTDKTADICKKYQESYPHIIRIISQERNCGLQENFVRTHRACRGEYIAICDADDFWINRHKLQIQIDFLEKNPKYVACFHRALNYYQSNGSKSISNGLFPKKVYNLADIINCNPVTNATVVFRNTLFPQLPSCFNQIKSNDLAMHILNAEHGDYYFMNKVMAVYRRHNNSAWGMSSFEEQALHSVMSRKVLIDYYLDKNEEIANLLIAAFTDGCGRLIEHFRNNNDNKREEEFTQLVFKYNPNFSIQRFIDDKKVKAKNSVVKKYFFRVAKIVRSEISEWLPLPKV